MTRICYWCNEFKCGGACGSSHEMKLILGEKDTQKYIKIREEVVNEYIIKASKVPSMVSELMDPEMFKTLSNFKSSEEAFKNLNEFRSLILCMENM